MKLRPLVIGDAERAVIRRIIEHAERNIVSLERLQRMVAGHEAPIGDSSDFVCVIPVGYRCVYSLEEQPMGICRHLSISVVGDGAAPNEAAVAMLATEFGFRDGMKGADQLWTESIGPGKVAINLMQSKDAT